MSSAQLQKKIINSKLSCIHVQASECSNLTLLPVSPLLRFRRARVRPGEWVWSAITPSGHPGVYIAVSPPDTDLRLLIPNLQHVVPPVLNSLRKSLS